MRRSTLRSVDAWIQEADSSVLALPNRSNCIYYGYTLRHAFEVDMSGQSVLKWGNSLAFRIPAAIARQMALNVGEQVEFHFDGEKLIIEKSDEVSPFNHRDLVRALKQAKRQRMEKIEFGAPRGKEIL